ncbi:MAG: methyltransferase [Bryobacteraceae bacterium]
MLKTQAAGQAERLKDYFRQAEFTPGGVRNRFQTDLLAGRHQENLPLLLYRTQELNGLNLLVRWFVVGEPVPRHLAIQVIPSDIVQVLGDCGLLVEAEENLVSPVMFAPFEKYWVATDTFARLSRGGGDDDVLMVNSTTLFLLNLAIRTPCRSLLDLGTGCGVVAIVAGAEFAGHVAASDLTSRAGVFARFNTWLNASSNVGILTGDLFQPVAGRRFDRILTNPPFYVTPSSRRIFAENPMDLDGFCRNLVKQAPPHLEEGGHLQMLCEWPEIEGQPWEERLAEWFEGTGCDAMVFQGGSYDPVRYAQVRLPVVSAPAGKEVDYRRFAEWVDYYKEKKVKAIHAGFLTMRRRSGQNWVHFERVPSEPKLPLGDAILKRFAVRDHPLSDEQILGGTFQIAQGVQLQNALEFRDQQWIRPPNVRMVQTQGLQLVHDLTNDVAEFVTKLDGSTPLGELVSSLAGEALAPRQKVEAECISLVKRLLDRGFVRESL